MSCGISLRGTVKAGLRGEPTPRRLLKRAQGFWRTRLCRPFQQMEPGAVRNGQEALLLRLHDCADPVTIATAGNELSVEAVTSTVGPGYHLWLCSQLKAMGQALHIEWLHTASHDDTGYFFSGDADAVRSFMDRWLQEAAQCVLDHASEFDGEAAIVRLDMDTSTPNFITGQPVLTSMGQRDFEWARKVVINPELGRGIFAWNNAGRLDARAFLGWARALMWTEVRWRVPHTPHEQALLEYVHDLLARAWREDPRLAYPFREWREITDLLGLHDALAEQVRRLAPHAPADPLIGYYRYDCYLMITANWRIRVPGSFDVEAAENVWTASDSRRAISCSCAAAPTKDWPDFFFGDIRDTRPGEAFFEHIQGVRHRQLLTARASLHEPLWTLTDVTDADDGHVAIVTASCDDDHDRAWLFQTVHSLQHAKELPGGEDVGG